MDTNNEIQEFIELLGFTSKNKIQYQKEYKLQKYTLKIDLEKGRIYYRSDDKTTVERVLDKQIQIGDKTTSNFVIGKNPIEQENFVVLEVVDRLLKKGYLPNDIHLERRYPSGRGASGGKSDVCIYGKDGKSLMVIECKTWEDEFKKELKKMEEHGGQLFAYLANDQNAKFLVLYASKLSENGTFKFENLIIHIKDREEDLKKSLKQIEEENIKLYRDANNKAELFEVWKELFNKYFHFNGIFDDDANAYSLELKALKKKNLKSLDNSQGLFNKFAEILRHNNISDNANAFNKILSLFLCKIVDEEKNDEDILDFQVKEDEEYENLIDRLQALYQKGMKKINEEIVYYSEADLHKIIKLYPKQTPIEAVEAVFRELKYYTNNEFAFKEVHNKKLFDQNGRVLTEVVKFIQNFRFKYNSQQQVLGDFFELMLNHGVKQSEGQFFTPIPIVRYIILSLGFEEIIQNKLKNDENFILPKILDYACGAGHFLTESIEELQHNIKSLDTSKLSLEQQNKIKEYSKGTEWTKDYIFGIEKDYRLARTSQIACYINGDGDANILFRDGLENHDQLQMEKKKFDIVIANPPYSVDAFKNYLNIGKTNYTLFEHLTERSSQIEALFIERTKQVLADNGLAGIILPSTILSNTGVYTKAREILLKYFEIKAITELGSKTFIATGTTTVILFLKRRNDGFLKDREYITEDVFNGVNIDTEKRYVKEKRFIELFCEHREFSYDDYVRFLKLEINDSLATTEMFTEYKSAFDDSTETKNLKKKTFFKNYTHKEKEAELKKRFYNYCKDIEKEKFLYFMLCLSDADKEAKNIEEYYKPQQTVIVKTGDDINKQKEFLGYEFQGKKGQEGIKINNNGGKLFDTINLLNPEKANSYIRQAMTNEIVSKIDESQKENTNIYNLVDLLSFNKIEFEKIIQTHSDKKFSIQTKWEIVKIGDVFKTSSGGTPLSDIKEYYENGEIPWINSGEVKNGKISKTSNFITEEGLKNSSAKLFPPQTILIAMYGATAGQVGYLSIEATTNQAVCALLPNKRINHLFLYEFLKTQIDMFLEIRTGVARPNLSQDKIKSIKIPIPPLEIQLKIISEIEKVEQKETKGLERVEQLEKDMQTIVKNIDGQNYKLKDIAVILKGTSITKTKTIAGHIPVIAGGQQAAYYHNESNREENIITISASGAYAGFLNYWTCPIFASDCTTIKSINENTYINKLVFYILKNKQEFFYKLQKGTAQPHVYGKDFQNLEIALPSIAEQEKLISIIEKKEKEINKIKLSLENVQTEKEAVLKKHL